jgi:acetolactate synthase-1/2/3 large subunit
MPGMQSELETETVGDAFIHALRELQVDHIFASLGSDHAQLIESFAKFKALGRKAPRLMVFPHESLAMSAAHGYAQATGRAQAVLVHVDVGTLNVGGAIHNINRARLPVLLIAGLAPVTLRGEKKGTRDTFIHFLQDTYMQAGIFREYTKWHYNLVEPSALGDVLSRALQTACSDPPGPVYLTYPKEVMASRMAGVGKPITKLCLPVGSASDEGLEGIARSLLLAKHPLIITTYAGRSQGSVSTLVRLAERAGAPVVEAYPYYLNFPHDHPHHLGFTSHPFLPDADYILVIDSDVPWIPALAEPRPGAEIHLLDMDPVKSIFPLWNFPVDRALRADSLLALPRICDHLEKLVSKSMEADITKRKQELTGTHQAQRKAWREGINRDNKEITPALLTAAVREVVGAGSIIVNENSSNMAEILTHIDLREPGSYMGLGGSSLGWALGAALGVKLARPEKDVVALVGDGTFFFGSPTAAYWFSRRYQVPFLTVIYNNAGWQATKQHVESEYRDGYAVKQNEFFSSFKPVTDFSLVGTASGAYGERVESQDQLKGALARGLEEVRKGRASVLDVRLPAI